MSDDRGPEVPGAGPQEPVGSVAEEAAKLFGALADLARGAEAEAPGEAPGPGGHGGGALGSLGDLAARAAAGVREAQGHLSARAEAERDRTAHDPTDDPADGHDHEGPDCRFCPVCRALHVVRQTSPEVRAHLADAGSSLLQAAAGWLATAVPEEARSTRAGVERIDLDGDPTDEADEQDRADRRDGRADDADEQVEDE